MLCGLGEERSRFRKKKEKQKKQKGKKRKNLMAAKSGLVGMKGSEVESRTQGSRPRPRTQKIRGQGQPF